MLATALIVFREVLEAALIISIVMAAAKGVAKRNLWIAGGVAAGLAGAGLIASFAGAIASAASGMGQELLNAFILMLAVVMLGWHNVWMSRRGREMTKEAGNISRSILTGKRPPYALAVIAGVALLREGSETVLFLYGITVSGSDSLWSMIAGGMLGTVAGCAIGIALYFGLLRIPVKQLFAVTGWMILLLAAGLAAQCAGFLVQADLLPPLGAQIWDTSAYLDEGSLFGKILHTLAGYTSRPAGIQVIFYVLTLIIIGSLMKSFVLFPKFKLKKAVVALVALVIYGVITPAHAYKVRSPIVDYRELEIEHNGSQTFDDDAALNNGRAYTIEVGYGILPFWKIELEGEAEAEPGEDLLYAATVLENYFQLTPQGKYWADLGFFLEYAHTRSGNSPDEIKFGPLAQKEAAGIGNHGSLHTANIFFKKSVGHGRNDDTGFSYAWQSRLRLDPHFEPGVEVYGGVGDISDAGRFTDQKHRAGPMFAGIHRLDSPAKIKYELGYLLPLTSATEDGVLRWKLELEIPM